MVSQNDDPFPRVDTTETPQIDNLSSSSDLEPEHDQALKPISRAKAKQTRKAAQRLQSNSSPSNCSLRPAKDILNRIRHDASFNDADYLIGYLDRHAGVMEMAAQSWGNAEVEEEEFIPQHRILYFKRVSDGRIVWDRQQRKDEIFGSGRR